MSSPSRLSALSLLTNRIYHQSSRHITYHSSPATRPLSTSSTGTSPNSDVRQGSEELVCVETVLGVKLRRKDYNPNLLRALSVENASNHEKRRVEKKSIIEQFRRSESDTGSPEVQIALKTERIISLTQHLLVHRKDTAKKRDMDVALSQRRRMMKYLFRISPGKFC